MFVSMSSMLKPLKVSFNDDALLLRNFKSLETGNRRGSTRFNVHFNGSNKRAIDIVEKNFDSERRGSGVNFFFGKQRNC